MRDLLGRRPNLASRNVDETIALLRPGNYDLEIARGDRPAFDFVSNIAYMPRSFVGYVRYGPAAAVKVPGDRKRDDYFIHLPAKGRCATENASGTFVCKRGQGVVSSPAGHVMRSEEGSSRVTISFTRSALIEQLTMLIGDEPAKPLEFAPLIDLHGDAGRRFTRQMRLLIEDLDDDAVSRNQALHAAYEQLIMTGLLVGQHHNYSEAINRLSRPATPATVKRAVDFIQDRLDQPITLADIVAASAIPGRTLLKHFQDHRGTSPMRYLRDERLARVREALLRAEGHESVTEIAVGLGVQHLGRFAVDYRRRFGERPSDTLRRVPPRKMPRQD